MGWAPTLLPKKRYFRLVDGASPGPDRVKVPSPVTHAEAGQSLAPLTYNDQTRNRLIALRTRLKTRMEAINCSNAQIAIAVDGKLKLFWSLTFGEVGWPMTQPTSKLRFGSCAKTLTAMRAVTLGEDFLKRPILSAMGANLQPYVFNKKNLKDSTVEDCLRYISGWQSGNRVLNLSWAHGREQLPLRGGDLGLGVSGATNLSKFGPYVPGTFEDYNNIGWSPCRRRLVRKSLATRRHF